MANVLYIRKKSAGAPNCKWMECIGLVPKGEPLVRKEIEAALLDKEAKSALDNTLSMK